MGGIDQFPAMIKLLKSKSVTPSRIAKEIGSDKRTVAKMLDVGKELNMISCTAININGKKYQTCSLDPKFRKTL